MKPSFLKRIKEIRSIRLSLSLSFLRKYGCEDSDEWYSWFSERVVIAGKDSVKTGLDFYFIAKANAWADGLSGLGFIDPNACPPALVFDDDDVSVYNVVH